MSFKLMIITPEAKVYEGEADSLSAPGLNGSFGILNNHAPMVSGLGNGEIILTSAGSEKKFKVDGGFLEVSKNVVSVMADSAEEV